MSAVAVLAMLISKVLQKTRELQSKIDILKIGLSGIAKRYGYKNVQELYHIYHKSHSAYVDYREQVAEWEKTYGENSQRQNKKVCLSGFKIRQIKQ